MRDREYCVDKSFVLSRFAKRSREEHLRTPLPPRRTMAVSRATHDEFKPCTPRRGVRPRSGNCIYSSIYRRNSRTHLGGGGIGRVREKRFIRVKMFVTRKRPGNISYTRNGATNNARGRTLLVQLPYTKTVINYNVRVSYGANEKIAFEKIENSSRSNKTVVSLISKTRYLTTNPATIYIYI